MKYNFNKVLNCKEGNCRKWSNYVIKEKFGLNEDVIFMDLVDIDFECVFVIKEFILKRVLVGDYSYIFIGDDFYDVIINWNKRRFDVYIEKDWIKLIFGIVLIFYYIV